MVRAVVDFLYKYYLRHRSSCRRISYGTGCDRYGTAGSGILVGIIGVVNGGGRIFWSTVSDWIGRGMTYIIFFAFEVFAFYRLSETTDSFVFQFLVLAVISCYGGGFSCMPAFLSDIFGVRQLAAIHGSILTAWGIAGIAGPVILALMKEATGSYSATLSLFSGMLALAFLISLLIHWQNETERKKWSVSAGNN